MTDWELSADVETVLNEYDDFHPSILTVIRYGFSLVLLSTPYTVDALLTLY